jgi:hypothetical protein
MVTDRRPSRAALRREYEASDALARIRVPASEHLAPAVETLRTARDAESGGLLNKACERFLDTLSAFYGVRSPDLRLLGSRPHTTYEGHLATELFGDYTFATARIRLWTRTAVNKQWTSIGTLLSTLSHEFMHHLDAAGLSLPHSYHTIGFFERTHRLYQAAMGRPYYPLVWRPPAANGSCSIDWVKTRQRKAGSGSPPAAYLPVSMAGKK